MTYIYQDRDNSTGQLWDGFDVVYRAGEPDASLVWTDREAVLSLAQVEQLRDALSEILRSAANEGRV